ncbi:MAG: class I SAM-dependent methyltransferase [Pseudohongiellaceae bacterium]
MPTSSNSDDLSNGWEAIASKFISIGSWDIGAATVEGWSKFLQPGQTVLDVGCGFGGPYTQGLVDKGFNVYGIDASETLIQEYQRRFPGVTVKCEAAEDSVFYDRKYDGILSVGLIFLLSHEDQTRVLQKMAIALKEGGKLLFSSPHQICEWDDLSTGRKSTSLGRGMYIDILRQHGLSLNDEYTDEGENHYYDFQKNAAL